MENKGMSREIDVVLQVKTGRVKEFQLNGIGITSSMITPKLERMQEKRPPLELYSRTFHPPTVSRLEPTKSNGEWND
ncbi:hypothetical protein MJO28_015409 [Puccinia striiformis f. sp. tritici]|uniref:Uncharacterized protein n=1 Tax=Puccinia striiformis f. sp. tritici TaxID=168172 RepID=A0ACC0DTZ3_9BASI|nr:hypothetical protein MJO28_015409 [Puccinia striiformis f. sp. tritici]